MGEGIDVSDLLTTADAHGGQDLGANPVEHITHSTRDWTLRLLLITLTVTPPFTGFCG